jgi:serine protease Do
MKINRFIATSVLVVAMVLAGCTGLSSLNSAVNSSLKAVANVAAAVAASATPSTATGAGTPTVAAGTQTGTGPTAAVVAPTVAPSASSAVPGDLGAMQSTFEQIYNQVNPSVVYIEVVEAATTGSGRFGNSGPSIASGSGFVWDTQGHIITNNHVVTGSTSIKVVFSDGTTASAKIVGQDPNADLAVIQVSVPASELHPVTVGDSTQVKVGQIVIAIGNPFGQELAGSMSEGIISGLGRTLPVESSSSQNSTGATYNIPDIIQTDAAINPGNSGGVLVNIQGEVIGVTAAIESNTNSNSGIGFVIPSAIVQKVVPSLISTGSYAHPWLGVTGTTLTPELATQMNLPATQRGALIIDLATGGPASKAGLKPSTTTVTINGIQENVGGDVVTAVNGQPVQTFEDLGSYLFLNTRPGDVVSLTVLRDGKEQTVKVTLGTLPNP